MNKKITAVLLTVIIIAMLCVCSCGCVNTDETDDEAGNSVDQGGFGGGEGIVDGEDEGNESGEVVENMKICIAADGYNESFYAELFDNETTRALYSKLPVELEMSDMPHEKYDYLGFSLPTSPQRAERIEVGDVMLWGDDCLVFFYESFNTSYSYTRLGKISGEKLLEILSEKGKIRLTVSKAEL